MKASFLQKKYPEFIYQNYNWKISNRKLKIFFNFSIPPKIHFRPEITILNIPPNQKKNLEKVLNNLIFHLGLIESLSYWKATCSPKIKILTGSLKKEQISWWKDLIINGMGQFFYENRIDFLKPNFLKINTCPRPGLGQVYQGELKRQVLIPIGGGKDSIVTLEILKKAKKPISCFSLNPNKISKKIMNIAGCKKPIIVKRKIDKRLLELNRKGFLNGHTPFSAYLAF